MGKSKLIEKQHCYLKYLYTSTLSLVGTAMCGLRSGNKLSKRMPPTGLAIGFLRADLFWQQNNNMQRR